MCKWYTVRTCDTAYRRHHSPRGFLKELVTVYGDKLIQSHPQTVTCQSGQTVIRSFQEGAEERMSWGPATPRDGVTVGIAWRRPMIAWRREEEESTCSQWMHDAHQGVAVVVSCLRIALLLKVHVPCS